MPMKPQMLARLRAEEGFGLIELMVAVTVMTIALLALAAGYDSAFVSLHRSSQKTVANALADRQLDLYRAVPFGSIGLDATATSSADSLYSSNSILDGDWVTDPVTGVQTQDPSGVVNDVTISGCGSTANCLPVQTITGSDGRSYRVESFVRDQANSTGIRWTERVVWVVVRDAAASGKPEILRLSTAFDRGPTG